MCHVFLVSVSSIPVAVFFFFFFAFHDLDIFEKYRLDILQHVPHFGFADFPRSNI